MKEKGNHESSVKSWKHQQPPQQVGLFFGHWQVSKISPLLQFLKSSCVFSHWVSGKFLLVQSEREFGVHLTTRSRRPTQLSSLVSLPLTSQPDEHITRTFFSLPQQKPVRSRDCSNTATVDEHTAQIHRFIYGWASTLTEVATSLESSQVLLPSWLFHEESDITSIWHPRLFLPTSSCYIYFVYWCSSSTLPLPIHMMQVCVLEVLFFFFLSGTFTCRVLLPFHLTFLTQSTILTCRVS